MSKNQKLFYILLASMVLYEYVNRPLVEMENKGLTGSMEYQILFQLMFGCLMAGFISIMELYRTARKTVRTIVKQS